jgi:hypothetical protein
VVFSIIEMTVQVVKKSWKKFLVKAVANDFVTDAGKLGDHVFIVDRSFLLSLSSLLSPLSSLLPPLSSPLSSLLSISLASPVLILPLGMDSTTVSSSWSWEDWENFVSDVNDWNDGGEYPFFFFSTMARVNLASDPNDVF